MTTPIANKLAEALGVIVQNASVIPDPTMNGSTDCYRVPLEDIDAAHELLADVIEQLARDGAE